jgi:hypothetical protein
MAMAPIRQNCCRSAVWKEKIKRKKEEWKEKQRTTKKKPLTLDCTWHHHMIATVNQLLRMEKEERKIKRKDKKMNKNSISVYEFSHSLIRI